MRTAVKRAGMDPSRGYTTAILMRPDAVEVLGAFHVVSPDT
jgi:hypothetical protein